jgi:hypothetical protein
LTAPLRFAVRWQRGTGDPVTLLTTMPVMLNGDEAACAEVDWEGRVLWPARGLCAVAMVAKDATTKAVMMKGRELVVPSLTVQREMVMA